MSFLGDIEMRCVILSALKHARVRSQARIGLPDRMKSLGGPLQVVTERHLCPTDPPPSICIGNDLNCVDCGFYKQQRCWCLKPILVRHMKSWG